MIKQKINRSGLAHSVKLKSKNKSRIKATPQSKQKKVVKKIVRLSQPVHKRFMLHPMSVLVLLCMIVLTTGWTYQAFADSFTVTASILAPPLNQGAVITSPVDGAVISTTPINVDGTCPQNSYVDLDNNNIFAGVAVCGSDGTFQIQTDLYSGENTLSAQDYNVTNSPGPTTNPVAVTYKVTPPENNSPTPSTSGSASSQSTTTSTSTSSTTTTTPVSVLPIILTSNFEYQTFITGTPFTWTINLQGGQPPYTVNINWGDGETSSLVFDSDPTFTITHIYHEQGYYPIKVAAVDKLGGHELIQLAALIKHPGYTGIINQTPSLSSGNSTSTTKKSSISSLSTPVASGISIQSLTNFLVNSKEWLWVAWPSLLVISLMVVSFWLGERQKVDYYLARKPYVRHKKHLVK